MKVLVGVAVMVLIVGDALAGTLMQACPPLLLLMLLVRRTSREYAPQTVWVLVAPWMNRAPARPVIDAEVIGPGQGRR